LDDWCACPTTTTSRRHCPPISRNTCPTNPAQISNSSRAQRFQARALDFEFSPSHWLGYAAAQKLFVKMNVETKNNVENVLAWIDSEEGNSVIFCETHFFLIALFFLFFFSFFLFLFPPFLSFFFFLRSLFILVLLELIGFDLPA
jgi:amino acid permease